MNNYKYKITGMTCTSCANAIDRKLKNVEGVNEVNVNLANETLYINYDSEKTNYNNIKKEVQSIGYDLTLEVKKEKKNNLGIYVALFLSLIMLYLSMTHMMKEMNLPSFEIISHKENPINFALAQLVITTIVIFLGRSFFIKGSKALINKVPNMDSLVAIGTGSAYIYSLFATYMIIINQKQYMDNLYFETAAVIIALVMLGKHLEDNSKKKTNDAIEKLFNLVPDTAIILEDNIEKEVLIELVKKDDICIIKAGSKIPIDGVILEGTAHINESHVTGESMPVKKGVGDQVIVGSILEKGYLKVRVLNDLENNTIAKIVKLMEDASMKKAPIAKLADTISLYFVPSIIVLAIVTSLLWYISGQNFEFVFTIFVSILVIACPCALGLATPVAIITATGKGASNGILVKSGEALEIMHKAKIVVFDKTGTLTIGKPVVTDMFNLGDNDNLRYLKTAESASEHPLASALMEYTKEVEMYKLNNFENISGLGLKATINNKEILIGSEKLMCQYNINAEHNYNNLKEEGKTVIMMAIDNKLELVVGIADAIKESSIGAIKRLNNMNIEVYMLTGDNLKTATSIANKLGIKNVIAEVLPEEKYLKIKELQQHGKVIMVGDGINDAIALTQADVGVAVSSGTDIAIESADVILMSENVNKVGDAIKLSHYTIRNIKQNLFWAFIYNILGIPVAAGLLYLFNGPLLNPILAGSAMAFSSLSVVLNALRLKRININK
jgi:P-type Cu+ transporter